jgi:peptide deformylase
MSILKIKIFPDEVLRKKTLPVVKITSEEHRLIQDMIETMYTADGVGLAANQVGLNKRIFVANPTGEKGKELVVINPRIVDKSGKERFLEGCLSLPGISAEVKRFKRLVVKAQAMDGRENLIHAEGPLARIFQHEIDHLDGILFIDHLGIFKRCGLLKKFKKYQQNLS